ncbi:MAG: glycosyltransferase family 2 protein [Nocardioidaceae bacterium]
MRKTVPVILVTLFTYAALAYLLFSHWRYAPLMTNYAVLHTLLFAHLALKVTASVAAKPHVADPDFDYDSLRVDVVVPIYNEDPALLAAGVDALAAQRRRPDHLWLIDDGSRLEAATEATEGTSGPILDAPLVAAAIGRARSRGIVVHTHRQENRGKRWAQSFAFKQSDADILVTIDSDTYLDEHAIEKLILPFSRDDVYSVAGLACGANYRKNLLTRAVDLGFTMSFLQGRLAEGFFGQVRVNCGIIAAYRAVVVRENLPRYLNQRFFGRPVKAGDDRALTYFAKERGRAECQVEAVAYSALPERLPHLLRQRMRWARSWAWGTLLLLRRPVTTADFWFTFTQLVGILAFGAVLLVSVTGVAIGAVAPGLLGNALLLVFVLGAVMHLRYVVAAHQRDPWHQRILTWLFSPAATLLYIGMTLPMYYRAMFRPRPQRTWGTRRKVEVRLGRQDSPDEIAA